MDVTSEDQVIHEGLRVRDETAAAKLRRRLQQFAWQAWLVTRLALILVPLILLSLLLLDIPFRLFDGFVSAEPGLLVSNWLSRGGALLSSSMFFLMLVTRRYGSVFTGRLVGLAWLVSAGVSIAMLIYLAPVLTPADMPSGRFVTGFLLSWYMGQLFAVYTYDYTRGGHWWRAPLYGGVFGFAVQTAIYFPAVYAESEAPWFSWMIMDFALKCTFCVAFLPVYYWLKGLVPPYLGVSGR